MAFNSFFYFLFLAVLFGLYYGLRNSRKSQNALILFASYFFYGCWDWRFLSLIIISTITDYFVAKEIEKADLQTTKRRFLYLSLGVNLGLLAFFKYFNFFIGSAADFLSVLGFQANMPSLYVILPVGISFYTFQTLSYTIDVYRGKVKPIHDLLDFSVYVSFFPQLVAGPIERPGHLLPQITSSRILKMENLVEGCHHILMGLFKKVVIADNMAALGDGVFSKGSPTGTGIENWIGLLAFALQIYGDFSGYSSIAQGSAKLFGFDLSYNFHMPYFASSPSEFWQRWHVTLSRWLRDYLYIPLGGNRDGELKTYRNLMLTMVIGGLWHGAGWHFVMWGFYHGLILCIFRFFKRGGKKKLERGMLSLFRNIASTSFMFMLTLIGWMFFRLDNVGQILDVSESLFTNFELTGLCIYMLSFIAFLCIPLFVYEYIIYRRDNDHLFILEKHWGYRAIIYNYFFLMMLFFSVETAHEFIYFQF